MYDTLVIILGSSNRSIKRWATNGPQISFMHLTIYLVVMNVLLDGKF